MTGVGVAGGNLKGGVDRAAFSPERDCFQEYSSEAGSLCGPCPYVPYHLSSTPAPSPTPVSVFASSRYVPVCRRAEEVV